MKWGNKHVLTLHNCFFFLHPSWRNLDTWKDNVSHYSIHRSSKLFHWTARTLLDLELFDLNWASCNVYQSEQIDYSCREYQIKFLVWVALSVHYCVHSSVGLKCYQIINKECQELLECEYSCSSLSFEVVEPIFRCFLLFVLVSS